MLEGDALSHTALADDGRGLSLVNGEVDLVINTTSDKKAISESYSIRRTALTFNIPYTTTIAGAMAMCKGIDALKKNILSIKTIQEYNFDTIRTEI